MPTQTQKGNNPLPSRWLMAVLGVVALIAIAGLAVSCSGSNDPTENAAPPLVSTPDHPVEKHEKSAEAMARQKQAMGESADRPPRPAFPMQH